MRQWFLQLKANPWIKWPVICAAVFVIIFLLALVANATINNIYQDKIFPNVTVGENELGKLDHEKARQLLQQRIDFIANRGFVYQHSLKNVIVYPYLASIESTDTSYALVNWDVETSLQAVLDWQSDNTLSNLPSKLKALWWGKDFVMTYQWDREQHLEILNDNLSDVLAAKQEASFIVKDGQLEIIPEIAGQIFDYQKALDNTEEAIRILQNKDIDLDITTDPPTITAAMIEEMSDEILNIKNRGNLHFVFDAQEWEVTPVQWTDWLMPKKELDSVYLGFDIEKVEAYFVEQKIDQAIEVPVLDARFEIIDGKVDEFVSSQIGRELDWEENLSTLENIINQSGELEVELATIAVEPHVTNNDVNDLGIVEIIGIGESDFSGSPYNRIHNITVGADTLNGVLIAPDEEFSLMDTLGEIDGESGYLQELVIKGNETKPEYGGGLCQIGTTVFRGALASGLDITARRNHSYRVSYYEPAGTDATIYDPWPDLKFKNDTGKHILIQTRIDGRKIYFDFWGTKDGRQVSMTEPVVYNIVPPPEKKVIKTLDLPVGEIKCTERAHNGADAKFDYTVWYPEDDEPVSTTFHSHYIPWQEVCLLGVTEEEFAAEQASSTPEESE
jgi:vancomycin resistance protein YoaR